MLQFGFQVSHLMFLVMSSKHGYIDPTYQYLSNARLAIHVIDNISRGCSIIRSSLYFVIQVSRGLTPNPDLQCNRHIKFQALLAHAQSLGAECIATGHYARLRHAKDGNLLFYCPSTLWSDTEFLEQTMVTCLELLTSMLLSAHVDPH